MRKRKFLIGTAATLALSVGISGVAHAAGTLNGQTVDAVVNSGKQDKKKPGPITTFTINVDTQYTGTTAPFDNKASNTKVDFPKDWSFFTTGLPQCSPASISTLDTAAAQATCPKAIVGSGKANLAGAVAGVTAVVTAFNGTPSGGNPVIILHSRTSAPLNSTASLIGTLRPGPGNPYGKTLDVIVPALGGGAFVITHFETTIPKKLVKKANKKKKKPAKFFVAAKCSTKSWQFQARTTYTTPANTPGASTVDTDVVPCKQKKKKKKK